MFAQFNTNDTNEETTTTNIVDWRTGESFRIEVPASSITPIPQRKQETTEVYTHASNFNTSEINLDMDNIAMLFLTFALEGNN